MHDIGMRQGAAGVFAARHRHLDDALVVANQPDIGLPAGAEPAPMLILPPSSDSDGPFVRPLEEISCSISPGAAPTASASPLTTTCGVNGPERPSDGS